MAIVTVLCLLVMAAIIALRPRLAPQTFAPASSALPAKFANRGDAKETAQIVEAYGKLPLAFEANRGQTDPRVKFLSRGPGYNLFLTPTGAVLSLHAADLPRQGAAANGTSSVEPINAARESKLRFVRQRASQTAKVKATVTTLQTSLVHANPAARVAGFEELPGKVNYFRGNNPKKWRTNVPTYARVRYENIYPGVDLVYYGNQQQLEYDFALAPGADPKRIEMFLRGAGTPRLDHDGNLVLRTAGQKVQFHKPVAYQKVGTARREIAVNYLLKGGSRVQFELGAYDATRPLVIDPVLSYSTYLGGNTNFLGFGISEGVVIAADPSGNAYVTGVTTSVDFPTTSGSFQANYGGENQDGFVAKLSADGSTLLYSTYLGSFANAGDTAGIGIAVDSSGNAYLTGFTNAPDFPISPGAFQSSPGGGTCLVGFLNAPCFDAFVTKLNSMGSALLYSTFLGGNLEDDGIGIAVDTFGNAYVVGQTASTNFPTTPGAFQTVYGGGNFDAFVAKIKPDGSGLVYSTYLGGSGTDSGFGGIVVDSSGNAYIGGQTSSSNFPTTAGAFQTKFGGGNFDAFATKLKPDGSGLVFSTFLGGTGDEASLGMGITLDSSGNVFATGDTSSTNFPTTPGAFQAVYGGGSSDAFVTKLKPDGSGLLYSTYLGGSDQDAGVCIAVDNSGNAYVAGETASANFRTLAALQNAFGGGTHDMFVTEVKPDASGLVFSTYLGGNNDDTPGCIALDGSGNVYVTGQTASSNFPLTPGAFQTTFGDGTNVAFVAKISPSNAPGLAFGPASLAFGVQNVGTTSSPQTTTLLNSGSATLNISTLAITGTNRSAFALASGTTCSNGTMVSAGSTCLVEVTFTPSAAGNASAAVTLTDNAGGSPQSLILTGTGMVPVPIVSLGPTNLNFPPQAPGTTSAAQTVTVNNTGSAALDISSVVITGANSSEFTMVSNTTCVNGTMVAVGSSCVVNVTFTPSAAGNASAAVTLTDNAADSPEMVPLSGSTPPPDFSFSAPPSPQTISAGQTAIFSLTLSASSGFSGNVSFTCNGQPMASTCSVSPNPAPISGASPTAVSVTVATTTRSFLLPDLPVPRITPNLDVRLALPWLALLLFTTAGRHQVRPRALTRLGLAGILLGLVLSFGCGGGSSAPPALMGTPAGTSTITVTGISGNLSHSTTLSLTVQ